MADTHRDTKKKPQETQDVDFTTTGDGTAWDSGRTSSITEGSRIEKDVREGDAEAPGVSGPKPGREGQNR